MYLPIVDQRLGLIFRESDRSQTQLQGDQFQGQVKQPDQGLEQQREDYQQQQRQQRRRQQNEKTSKHQSIYGRLHWAPGMGIDPAGGWEGE